MGAGIKLSAEFVQKIGKKFPPESNLAIEGQAGTTMFIIAEGKVGVIKNTAAGEKMIATLESGDFFGEMAILGHNDKRGATVKTLTQTTVIELNRDAFEGLIRRSPEIAMIVIKSLADRVRDANGKLSSLIHRDTFMRLAAYYQFLSNDRGAPAPDKAPGVVFPIKCEVVASTVGVTKDDVEKFLNMAQKAKILGRNGEWLWIPFPQYLLPFGQLLNPLLGGKS